MDKFLFEVFNSKGKRLYFTESKECIPSKKELEHRAEVNGYTYMLNGKPYKAGTGEAVVNVKKGK